MFVDAFSNFAQARLAKEMSVQNYHPSFIEAVSSYVANWDSMWSPGQAGWTEALNTCYSRMRRP